MECAASRHVTLCDADSRGFIVVAFCSAILHHWMCKIPTEVATLTARPYRSCDRGLNEHTNGLIRRFLPKGTDFNEVSDKEIAKIEHTLNTRRRASLNYRSPNHVFLEYLMAA
ncbi:Transposase, IS30 family [Piscirickettsia salmonis]|nr:Transposase, IS30 family [Piscirickettsia salmonis]